MGVVVELVDESRRHSDVPLIIIIILTPPPLLPISTMTLNDGHVLYLQLPPLLASATPYIALVALFVQHRTSEA